MRKLVGLTMLLIAASAHAQWQADLEFGQGDGIGVLLFFFAFAAWAYVRDEFKKGPDKGWRAVVICAIVLSAAIVFPVVRILAAILFLASMANFAWRTLRGPRR